MQMHIEADRVHQGEQVKKSLFVEYRNELGMAKPILHIKSDWLIRKKQYKTTTDYTCEEFACSGSYVGRGFRLTRVDDPEKIYDVFVAANGQDSHCDCDAGSYGNKCKHLDGLLALLESGAIDDSRECTTTNHHVDDFEFVF